MSSSSSLWRALGLACSLGFVIALPIAVGTVIGVWLDKTFHSFPYFLLGGILFGLAVAAAEIYKIILPFLEKQFPKLNK